MEASLTIRKRADKSEGRREMVVVDGRRRLVNPDTPGDDHEPWPLAGVAVVGDLPDEVGLSTQFVAQGIAEGWISGEEIDVVHRPGGPADNQWAVTHTFVHYNKLTFDFEAGAAVYKVTHQPDKYVAEGTDKTKVTPEIYAAGETRVDKFYTLKLQKGS
jgi:hypothetical protein